MVIQFVSRVDNVIILDTTGTAYTFYKREQTKQPNERNLKTENKGNKSKEAKNKMSCLPQWM